VAKQSPLLQLPNPAAIFFAFFHAWTRFARSLPPDGSHIFHVLSSGAGVCPIFFFLGVEFDFLSPVPFSKGLKLGFMLYRTPADMVIFPPSSHTVSFFFFQSFFFSHAGPTVRFSRCFHFLDSSSPHREHFFSRTFFPADRRVIMRRGPPPPFV